MITAGVVSWRLPAVEINERLIKDWSWFVRAKPFWQGQQVSSPFLCRHWTVLISNVKAIPCDDGAEDPPTTIVDPRTCRPSRGRKVRQGIKSSNSCRKNVLQVVGDKHYVARPPISHVPVAVGRSVGRPLQRAASRWFRSRCLAAPERPPDRLKLYFEQAETCCLAARATSEEAAGGRIFKGFSTTGQAWVRHEIFVSIERFLAGRGLYARRGTVRQELPALLIVL